jgi:hypothetical protein
MQETYQWHNHENTNTSSEAGEYMLPQVMEFDDMHYIERKRLESERGKNLY